MFLCAVLFLGAAADAVAQFQVDIGINIPYYLGIKTEDDDVGDTLDWVFLVPDVKFNWMHPVGAVKIGGGVRLWTFIIQSVAYPIVSVEADVGPFVLNANAGGGAFLFFGLYSSMQFGSVFIPEVSVAYRFTPGFSAGTGAVLLFAPETADLSSFGYMGTVFARFTIKPSSD
jgi:hypothetical protein